MNILKIKLVDEQWVELEFRYNRRFTEWISEGIRPIRFRRYDKPTKKWQVHQSKLPLVVHFGRRFFHQVDYSSLPEATQIWIVSRIEAEGWRTESSVMPSRTPHQVLHLLPTAPQTVVKAAYKALAIMHHPDHGGDAEAFREVQEAYEELVQS